MKNKDYERQATILSPIVSIILGLLVGFILLLILGYDAVEGYKNLFLGGIKGIEVGNLRRFANTLSQMTPLIFTGASVAFAFRTGLFNIGATGQFLFGGFVAVVLGVHLDLPRFILPIVCVIGAGVAGGIWGAVPGILKAKFNINEVVICIMMNYTALWLVQLFSKMIIPDTVYYPTQSAQISPKASLKAEWLTNLTNNSSMSMAFFIGIGVLVAMYIILEKTTFGYELKAVGYNKNAAKYAGIKVNKNIVMAMVISGAMAGMGGAAYYIGFTDHIRYAVLLSYGFDGIAVALLGLVSPIGVFLSSFLFGFLKNGGAFMESSTKVPKEIVSIFVASIIYFSAISLIIKNIILKILKSKRGEE